MGLFNKKSEDIKLGDFVKDTITGFEGIAVAYTQWYYGCKRWGIQSKKLKEDGTTIDPLWFDEGQLIKINEEVQAVRGIRGGPTPISKRNIDPIR